MLSARGASSQKLDSPTLSPGHRMRQLAEILRHSMQGRGRPVVDVVTLPYRLLRSAAIAIAGGLGLGLLTSMQIGFRIVSWPMQLFSSRSSTTSSRLGPLQRLGLWATDRLVRALRACLSRPGLALWPTGLLVVLTLWQSSQLGSSLVPEVHRGLFDLRVTLPVGTPLQQTASALEPLEKKLTEDAEVALLSSFIGVSDELWRQGSEGEHTATLRIRMRPGDNMGRREEDLIKRVRHHLQDLPDARGRIERPAIFSFAAPVEVLIRGVDLQVLRQASQQVSTEMQAIDLLTDVKSSARDGYPELRVE